MIRKFYQNSITLLICLAVIHTTGINALAVGTLVRLSTVVFTGGAGNPDMAHAVAIDSSGNVIVTGENDESEGGGFMTTRKYDNNLALVKTQSYEESSNFTYGRGVAIDSSGEIFACGYSNNNWSIIKYDSGFNSTVSIRTYGDSAYIEEALAVTTDSSDNVFITGYNSNSGNENYYTMKCSNDLSTVLDSASYDGPSPGVTAWAYGIAVDASDNVFVTGKVEKGSVYDWCTIKYNNNLVVISSTEYKAAAGYIDVARGIAIDDSGNVYVVGYSSGSAGTDVDLIVVKYDNDLVFQASAVVSGIVDGICLGYAIDIDIAGNIIAGGSYSDSGVKGFLTVRFDSDLTIISSATFNTSGNEEIYGIAVDDTGNIYAAGYKYNGGDQEDYLIMKYNGLPVVSSLSSGSAYKGDTLNVTVPGYNYLSGITASFSGTGIIVNSVNFNSPAEIILNITVASDAGIGKRSLTLTNTDEAFYTKTDSFEVLEATEEVEEEEEPELQIVKEPGNIKIVGSEERKGVINPDKGDIVEIYFKGTDKGKYYLKIFTVLGELVHKETKTNLAEGNFSWIPEDIASGIYIAHVKGPGIDVSKKIAILR